ncbi:hypothetical protein C6Y14_28870 [Streptomyces dioscori]|uniref:Nudix hydrolase domain-containing protein n=1 Tax=Streptomyces dioscori TaxID=2109333 RepID=A0A2P8Q0W3_9ACTN|nr:NUDIX hydrolase [Streptomyces dioscori]PSM39899.1 hypothetical protein C6Y14_28870 [Streptomyces dioscori]
MAVIVNCGRILMIRRSIVEGDLVWALPGGKVETGESAEQAAVRETLEETGLDVKALRRLGERTQPDTGRQIVYVACRAVGGQARAAASREVSDVAWVEHEQIPEYVPQGLYGPVQAYVDGVAGVEGKALYPGDRSDAMLLHSLRKDRQMPSKKLMDPRRFGDHITTRARIVGYDLATKDGQARLAKDSGLPEADIAAITEGKYKPSVDPWKTFAEILGERHKDMLCMVGRLAPSGTRPPKKSVKQTAGELGIKQPKTVAIFEALVTALLNSEK